MFSFLVLFVSFVAFQAEILKGFRPTIGHVLTLLQDAVAIFCHEYAGMILQLCSHIVHVVLNVLVSYIFIIASLFAFAQIVSFLMFGFYYAATSGVINLPPSKRLYSYVFRHDNRYYNRLSPCDVKRLVKVYNYPKDIGVRVESFGVRIAFGGKGGSNNISSLSASLARTMAGLAMLMQVLLTHPRRIFLICVLICWTRQKYALSNISNFVGHVFRKR